MAIKYDYDKRMTVSKWFKDVTNVDSWNSFNTVGIKRTSNLLGHSVQHNER